MLEHFKPKMQIVAVGNENALVTFDSAAEYDIGRSPVALRIPRDFSEIKIQLGDVVESPDGDRDSKRPFRCQLKLMAKPSSGDEIYYNLADLHLRLAPVSKPKRGAPATDFPATYAVAAAVQQGVAAALAEALVDFAAREGELAVARQFPANAYVVDPRFVDGDRSTSATNSSYGAPVKNRQRAANETDADRKKFHKQMVAAAVLTPVIVIGGMWLASGKSKPADPIQEAVAQAMIQSPAAAQAQVDLTKETLKQMGLDPGAAGDTGCLAVQ